MSYFLCQIRFVNWQQIEFDIIPRDHLVFMPGRLKLITCSQVTFSHLAGPSLFLLQKENVEKTKHFCCDGHAWPYVKSDIGESPWHIG